MKIKLTSVFVNDQNKALDFYTKTLASSRKQTSAQATTDG
jgi:hypothetical protein